MDDVRWLDPRESRAWRGWLAASELLRAQIGRDLLADSGISDADYVVLVFLSEAPGQRGRMTDLAAALRWSKSRLSHQVTRMEQRGLLTRAGCSSDGRGSFALLTDAGLAEIRRAAPAHVASVRDHLIGLLTDEQLDVLGDITEHIISHLLSQPGAPAPPPACPQSAGGAADPRSGAAGPEGKLVG